MGAKRKPNKLRRRSRLRQKKRRNLTRRKTKNPLYTPRSKRLTVRPTSASSKWFANDVKWLPSEKKRMPRTQLRRKKSRTGCFPISRRNKKSKLSARTACLSDTTNKHDNSSLQ